MIDGDAVRGSDFVLSAVSFSDGSVIVVFALSLFGEFTEKFKSDFCLLFIFLDQRQDSEFYRSELFWESDDGTGIIFIDFFFVVKFEHGYHNLSA